MTQRNTNTLYIALVLLCSVPVDGWGIRVRGVVDTIRFELSRDEDDENNDEDN